MIKVLVLICSVNLPCDVENALDVIHGRPAKSVFDCILSGQATVAQTAIKPKDGEYMKLVCTRFEPYAVNVAGNASISTEWRH